MQADPDTDYGYHKMTYVLLILGYLINHKKVYRLMNENDLLKDRLQKPSRSFVKYRRVMPSSPLEILEMDIKFVWVEEYRRSAYVLTVVDTFTRVVLCWHAGYQIRQAQIKSIWEYIIVHHLQPYDCLGKKIRIEIRNDNDSRFVASSVQEFFRVYRILCVNACIQILHLSSNLIKNCCRIIPQSRMGKVHFFSILAIAR